MTAGNSRYRVSAIASPRLPKVYTRLCARQLTMVAREKLAFTCGRARRSEKAMGGYLLYIILFFVGVRVCAPGSVLGEKQQQPGERKSE